MGKAHSHAYRDLPFYFDTPVEPVLQAIAAAEAGKHVICEKPLAVSASQAAEMLQAVKKAGVMHMICHNYRFAPAIQLAKKLIDGHIIGYEHTFINMMEYDGDVHGRAAERD